MHAGIGRVRPVVVRGHNGAFVLAGFAVVVLGIGQWRCDRVRLRRGAVFQPGALEILHHATGGAARSVRLPVFLGERVTIDLDLARGAEVLEDLAVDVMPCFGEIALDEYVADVVVRRTGEDQLGRQIAGGMGWTGQGDGEGGRERGGRRCRKEATARLEVQASHWGCRATAQLILPNRWRLSTPAACASPSPLPPWPHSSCCWRSWRRCAGRTPICSRAGSACANCYCTAETR